MDKEYIEHATFSNKIIFREIIKPFIEVTKLTHVIYYNFKYLEYDPILKHKHEDIVRLLQSNDISGYLAYDIDKSLIGYIIGEYINLNDGRRVFYVTYLFVIKRFRHKKIGSHLIEYMMNKCKMNNIREMMLTFDTNDSRLITFYKKHGFKQDLSVHNPKTRHQVWFIEL
jgi:GNAT superfamily N-acetyltransferase